jgi:hypothetical protein
MNTGTNLVEYANRFHHDTNAAWETEQINVQELAGVRKENVGIRALTPATLEIG